MAKLKTLKIRRGAEPSKLQYRDRMKETLERMGIPKREDQTLIQTSHILHKQGRYYICHFKELFALDGKEAELSEEGKRRHNSKVYFSKLCVRS